MDLQGGKESMEAEGSIAGEFSRKSEDRVNELQKVYILSFSCAFSGLYVLYTDDEQKKKKKRACICMSHRVTGKQRQSKKNWVNLANCVLFVEYRVCLIYIYNCTDSLTKKQTFYRSYSLHVVE